MRYAIFGANRVAKDFLYVFEGLDICCFIDERNDIADFLGYKIYSVEEGVMNGDYDQIIVCDFDKAAKDRILVEYGLEYGKDFVHEEDLFYTLDEIKIPENKIISIWGTGTVSKEFYKISKNYNISCYIDTYKEGENFNNIPVIKPSDISDWNNYFIIIAIAKDEEIVDYLKNKNLIQNEDFVSFQKILGRPSELIRKTIFDKSCYDLECNTMLNHLEVFYKGNTRCCCTTFVQENLDNIFEKDAYSLWHSNVHKIMCLSTQNKTYSFCNKSMCPLFVGKRNLGRDSSASKREIEYEYKTMTDEPAVLAIGHDSTCNLACETCRAEPHIAKDAELELVRCITAKIKEDYLKNCKFLILAGDGEVFMSPAYKDIYNDTNCNPEYIRLLSNGTLFTPSRWNEFAAGKKSKIMLTVSIDAATKETYEAIRRNGSFEKLQSNMVFASELRKSGELRYFRLNFVVQKRNYQEMIKFVQWGEELGVDEIFFTKILNWGTYTEEEFAEVSMMESDGITPKPELLEVLNAPIIKNSDIVDMGTIQYSHKNDYIGVVENYYKWELEKRGGRIFD